MVGDSERGFVSLEGGPFSVSESSPALLVCESGLGCVGL
jgi:hypothetical protein